MPGSKIRIQLAENTQPIEPTDPLSQAIRKAILWNLAEMLEHEQGARNGEDIEDIHKMRVATRRMRSLIRLNEGVFKPKVLKPHKRDLGRLATTLGHVRDLDVQLVNLRQYQQAAAEQEQVSLQTVIEILEQGRKDAHKRLVTVLDSNTYRQFLKRFGAMLSKPNKGFKAIEMGSVEPHELRHILPVIIHENLARVRAYDSIMENIDESGLHALRIECKRLRYLLTAFESALGSTVKGFVNHLKILQDHLGVIHDTTVTSQFFLAMLVETELDGAAHQAIESYIRFIDRKHQHLVESFELTWTQFNTRQVQRQLSDALLVLR